MRRRQAETRAPFELLDFMLRYCRSPEEVAALEEQGIEYDPFVTFIADTMPVEDFMALWAEYESAIRTEARRRGVPVPDPMTYRPHPAGAWVRYGDQQGET